MRRCVTLMIVGSLLALAPQGAQAQGAPQTTNLAGATIAGLQGPLVLIGDRHSDLNALREALATAGVVSRGSLSTGLADRWMAAARTTVFLAGDLVTYVAKPTPAEYSAAVRILDYAAYLAGIARSAGGTVEWQLGNHDLSYLRATAPGQRVDASVLDLGNRIRAAVIGSPTVPGFLKAVSVAGADTVVSHGVIVGTLLERLALSTRTPLVQVRQPAVFARLANDALSYSAKNRVFASSIFASDVGVCWRVASDEVSKLSTFPFAKNIVGHDWVYAMSSGGHPLFFAATFSGTPYFLACVDDATGKGGATTPSGTVRFVMMAGVSGQLQLRSWTTR